MFVSKCFFFVVFLCVVHETLSKPTESAITQGRSIGSTIWGWITYPFSGWWGSSESEHTPINDKLIASTTYGPNDNIDFGKHNVTVWCNEQTCTTMKCNKNGCKNNTCNMYDTYLDGECREYNTVVDPDKPMTPLELTTISSPPQNNEPVVSTTLKVAGETTNIPEITPVLNIVDNQTKTTIEKIETTAVPYNKITETPTSVGISLRVKESTKDHEDPSKTTSSHR